MLHIPLEDNFDDVINKAQRGLRLTDRELARRAGISVAELVALKSGVPDERGIGPWPRSSGWAPINWLPSRRKPGIRSR